MSGGTSLGASLTYTRPWTISMTAERQKNVGILEYECHALLEESGVPLTWPRDYLIRLRPVAGQPSGGR